LLLRSLHADEEIDRGLFQTREVRVSEWREAAGGVVQPIADAVRDDGVAGGPKRCHVAQRLLKRAFDTGAQALRFDHEPAVRGCARQRLKHSYIDASPLDRDA